MTNVVRRGALPFALLLALLGCSDDSRVGGRPDGGAVPDGGGPVAGCSVTPDSDGDGIADDLEGMEDFDGDGTPNSLDLDSDGDGVDDATEHGGAHPCAITDSDGDGSADWRDLDSDNDGLSDADEVGVYFTDRTNIDSDGDGVTDFAEVEGSGTDPSDPTSTIPEGDFFVVLPFGGPMENRTLRFGTNISVADVYFLIDTTGSMGGPIDNVTSSLMTIATEISSRIEDVQMGVGHFDDFPNDSNPLSFTGYGAAGDIPYANDQIITGDIPAVQRALGTLSAAGGGDGPESHVEALYRTATGLGESWSFAAGGARYSLPPATCPSIPDEPGPRRGYPCFRTGALPIIIVVTDVVWHNGPGGSNAYTGITPAAKTFDEAVSAMRTIGARFIGVAVDGGGRSEAEEMARQTGTVDGAGRPLVFDSAGGTVDSAIVDGISALTGGVAQDVTTRTENVMGNPDEFDATRFIKAITPIEGYRDGIPGAGYDSKDDVAFYNVIPGTFVDFGVSFFNDVRPSGATAELFQARIIVVGNGVADLDSRNVYIIVPPDGGTILI